MFLALWLLAGELVMHLLLFSDEESEGSLPGSSDVSPRNAPSVHRIVNRCVPAERNTSLIM